MVTKGMKDTSGNWKHSRLGIVLFGTCMREGQDLGWNLNKIWRPSCCGIHLAVVKSDHKEQGKRYQAMLNAPTNKEYAKQLNKLKTQPQQDDPTKLQQHNMQQQQAL